MPVPRPTIRSGDGRQPRRRRTVRIDAEHLVRIEPPPAGAPLPALLAANRPDVRLTEWLGPRRTQIFDLLHRHGALLFRGFPLDTPAALEAAMHALDDAAALPYSYRSTPRSQVSGRVYTSTDYPAERVIPQHSEQAYSRSFPRLVGFLCLIAARHGGATPLADNRRVLARIPPKVRDRFARHGVLYVRNYGGPLDLGWREVFQTDARDDVERFCAGEGIEVQWGPNERLRTRQVCPAVIPHPATGEPVWFNQAHLFHTSALGAADHAALLATCGGEDGLPRQARFGNGATIPPGDLLAIRDAFAAETIRFDWQPHDLLLVDNVLASHGREAFAGERRVVVCMTGAASTQATTTEPDA
ncbi:MAG: TauD/TfdA family dioxygenase [Planctomycetota bacterium]